YRQDLSDISNSFGATRISFSAGSEYYHRYSKTFGDMPPSTWHPESRIYFTSFSNTTPMFANATWDQVFGSIYYDCPYQKETVSFDGHVKNVRGDFVVTNTGNRVLELTNSAPITMNIGQDNNPVGGDLSISGMARVLFSRS